MPRLLLQTRVAVKTTRPRSQPSPRRPKSPARCRQIPRAGRPCRQTPSPSLRPGGAPSPTTPCTLPRALRAGGTPTRRTGHSPKYIQYEDPRPAHREHAPPSSRLRSTRGDPHDAAAPALRANDGNVTTGPSSRRNRRPGP
ncbi:hypothetical protein CTZ28_35835 [Streptomyces shenzhenensis]|uniref:Uncharacterized protein n=1 Tax=Streptomyces shenzhenensis TaxID=943815 RepID=A0A3M0I4Y6_9ACTN|nr:hypothetical protein CTZ28_35835 [Streptomyces shenzhenensis]